MTRLIYFAWVRERIGKADEEAEIASSVVTVADLLAWQQGRGEEYAYAFENAGIIRVALDKRHAPHDAPIAGAREIAFFPPMTGG
jgi:molybdopterin synthase sulfur carrier subunit